MMNKLKTLILIQLKETLGKSRGGMNIKNRKLGRLLQLVVVLVLAIPITTFSITAARAFVQLGQPELLITSMYVNSVLLAFFLGIPFLVSVFFYSRDTRFLATLPVREDIIIISKLSTVYLYLLTVSTIFMGPALVIYAINIGLSLSLIIGGFIALIMAPVLPLLISALLVLVFSKFITRSRHKNLLTILSSILLILVILAVQLVINRFTQNPEYLQHIYSSSEGLIGFIGMRFPPSIWMTRMVMGSVIDGLLFIGSSILFLLVLQSLSRVYFKRSLLSFQQGVSAATGNVYYKKRSRGLQLLRRNILIILKEPTFLLNTLLSMVVPLILFGVMAFSGGNEVEMLKSPQLEPYMILILSGILISPAIVSNISATAITREGKAFWETRVFPVPSEENIRYRILTTILISLAGSLLLLPISIFILPVTSGMILPALLLAVTGTLFLATVDFIVNIFKPQLNWTHPTAAVKNNMSVTISLGIRAVIGVVVYGIYKIVPGLFDDFNLVVIGAGVVFFILYLTARSLLYSKHIKQFEKISI